MGPIGGLGEGRTGADGLGGGWGWGERLARVLLNIIRYFVKTAYHIDYSLSSIVPSHSQLLFISFIAIVRSVNYKPSYV